MVEEGYRDMGDAHTSPKNNDSMISLDMPNRRSSDEGSSDIINIPIKLNKKVISAWAGIIGGVIVVIMTTVEGISSKYLTPEVEVPAAEVDEGELTDSINSAVADAFENERSDIEENSEAVGFMQMEQAQQRVIIDTIKEDVSDIKRENSKTHEKLDTLIGEVRASKPR